MSSHGTVGSGRGNVGSGRATVQVKLQENVAEFSSLIRQLLEAISSGGGRAGSDKVTTEIVQKLTSRNDEIQKLAGIAMEMCACQGEVSSVMQELDQRKQEVSQLQAHLQEAERIIELAVYKGRQKLEAIEQAEKGAVSAEELLRYAHRISQASSVVSPVGWQLSDSRRPFPQDIEMRRGLLGQLTSGAKPHSQAGTGGGGDMLPPPEKKFALAGMNQNLNNRESGVATQLGLVMESSRPVTEPEIMSEDSSASSDEAT